MTKPEFEALTEYVEAETAFRVAESDLRHRTLVHDEGPGAVEQEEVRALEVAASSAKSLLSMFIQEGL